MGSSPIRANLGIKLITISRQYTLNKWNKFVKPENSYVVHCGTRGEFKRNLSCVYLKFYFNYGYVIQSGRDNRLKICPVWVRVPP